MYYFKDGRKHKGIINNTIIIMHIYFQNVYLFLELFPMITHVEAFSVAYGNEEEEA